MHSNKNLAAKFESKSPEEELEWIQQPYKWSPQQQYQITNSIHQIVSQL
jgi:hypothetical protein